MCVVYEWGYFATLLACEEFASDLFVLVPYMYKIQGGQINEI